MTRPDDLIAHPLTAVRLSREWTLAQVAEIVQRRSNLNMRARREKVWRWENGRSVPEIAAQHALAKELGVDPTQVTARGWPDWLTLAADVEGYGGEWTSGAATDVLGRVVSSAPMDRRSFLMFSRSAAAELALAWSGATPAPLPVVDRGRITAETVDHIHARVEQLWHLDDLLGGGSVLDAGIADLRLVHQLIRHGTYDAAVGVRLWSLAASLARFAGWAAFDAGLGSAAQRYWHAGLRAASVAGDTDQGVYVLSNLALQAAYAHDGPTTVRIIDVARSHVDPAARTVLAMLDTWAVRGHSVAGDARAAAATLNRADDLWQQRVPGDDPGWVYWMPQPSLTAEAGTALLEIGDLAAAERNLTTGLAALDGDSARDRNLYLTRLAEVQLRGGRLDEATVTARAAIDAAAGIDSARVQRRVDALLDELPQGEPVTAELRDYRREQAP